MLRTLQSRMVRVPVAATLRGFQSTAAATTATLRPSLLLRAAVARTAPSFLASVPPCSVFDRPPVGPTILAGPTPHQHQQQVRYRSNRSRRGLYDGKDVRTGNNVSFSMKATKRKFKPNVFVKRVYSQLLNAMIPFHLTASTLRSIDKAGGLDEYLLHPKRVITEGEGYVVKRKLLQRIKNQERYNRKQREKMAQQHQPLQPQSMAVATGDMSVAASVSAPTDGVSATAT